MARNTSKTEDDGLTPELRRKLKRLRRRMDRQEAAGGVTPPEQRDQLRRAGGGASGRIVNGQLTIMPGKPRLTVVK